MVEVSYSLSSEPNYFDVTRNPSDANAAAYQADLDGQLTRSQLNNMLVAYSGGRRILASTEPSEFVSELLAKRPTWPVLVGPFGSDQFQYVNRSQVKDLEARLKK